MPELTNAPAGTAVLTSRIWFDDGNGGGIYGANFEDVGGVAWGAAQPIREISGTAGTVVSTDAGGIINCTSASAGTVVVNTSTDFSAGQRAEIRNGGAGQITVAADGVTVNATPGKKLRAQYSWATLVCVGTDTYDLIGDLSA